MALILLGAGPAFGRHIPITELIDTYEGEPGGLYGDWSNLPPQAHWQSAVAVSTHIVPRDRRGVPSNTGKIGLIVIGPSTTSMLCSSFRAAVDESDLVSPALVVVNAAQEGTTASRWVTDTRVWNEAYQRVIDRGLTSAQVQVAWIKVAASFPRQYGSFAKRTAIQADQLGKIVRKAKKMFPNLRIAYLSSRMYNGYAKIAAIPEPYAFETAFNVRQVILRQIAGDPWLNWNPDWGPVEAPVLLWGPYLWADGATPRLTDGFRWNRGDFAADGTHPSASGRQKVIEAMFQFFSGEPSAQGWFLAP